MHHFGISNRDQSNELLQPIMRPIRFTFYELKHKFYKKRMDNRKIESLEYFINKYPEERDRLKDLLPEGPIDILIKYPNLLVSRLKRSYYYCVDYDSYLNRVEDDAFLKEHPDNEGIKIITYK